MDNQNNNPTETNNSINTNPIPDLGAPTFETIPENNINPAPTPEPAVETIETLDDVSPTSPQPNIIQDNFNSVPVPPTIDAKEKKPKKAKKSNKLLFIILIIILIAGIGYGIYYYLTLAKNSAPQKNITVKELALELGESLSDDIDDYASISGYDKSSCTLDTSEVEIDKVGEYHFYVTCGDNKQEGTIKVDDTTIPTATLNEVTVLPNATIKPEDFIDTCIDASECTYEFADEDMVETYLKTIGEYDVEINVKDEYNNENVLTGKLIVSADAPVKYVTCTSKSTDVSDISATKITTYRIGVNSSNKFYNATRKSEFTFNKLDDYNNMINDYDETGEINNLTGTAEFNETLKTITISSNITFADLNKDLDITLSEDIITIQTYLSIMGYTCE